MRISNSWTSLFFAAVVVSGTQAQEANSPHQSLADKVAAEDQADDKSAAGKAKREEAERQRQAVEMRYWIKTLDPLPQGGWVFQHYADDWTWALFTSKHQRKRIGEVVTLWLRWEHRDTQLSNDGTVRYRSSVEKDEFDCAGSRVRTIAETAYSERNLKGDAHSTNITPALAQWTAVIPGTQGEYNLSIACGPVR